MTHPDGTRKESSTRPSKRTSSNGGPPEDKLEKRPAARRRKTKKAQHSPPSPDPADKPTWPIFQDGEKSEADSGRTFPMHSADELGQFSAVEWLIKDWLPARDLTMIWGKGDTLKSFIAQTWACQLAAEGRSVLYIAAEGMSGLRARIAAWQVHNDVPSLPTFITLGMNLAVQKAEERKAWLGEVQTEMAARELASPDFVVIDTLARCFVGGDESSPKDMGQFVEGCKDIMDSLQTAVAVIHHSDKEGKAERGTESLRNASFASYEAKREKSMTDHEVKLTCDRMKDAEKPDPTRLKFEWLPLPWIQVPEGDRPPSSLHMKEPFPPEEKDADRPEFRDAALAVLEELQPGDSIAAKALIEAVRKSGFKISQEKAKDLLRAFAGHPGIRIEHVKGEGYRLVEAQA